MVTNLLKFSIMFIVLGLVTIGCNNDDDDDTMTIDPTQPTGEFMVNTSGNFVSQNNAGSTGMAEVGQDEDGEYFLHFSENFNTNLNTGTVSAYFSTSSEFMPAPGEGNPNLKLVGNVQQSGEYYYKLDGALDSKFSHVILWCNTASIPFGYAELQ